MFDELKEVKYFKEITDSKITVLWWEILYRNKTFEESSKSRDVFRTQASIYNGVFLWMYYFYKKAPYRWSTGLYIGHPRPDLVYSS